jgi:TRAP-type C4-dicarboxylate transport system permease small subunit
MTDASLPTQTTGTRSSFTGAARTIDLLVARIIDLVTMTLLGALFLLICWIVVGRLLKFGSPAWTDEIVEFMLAWLIFLGAAGLWRNGEQFRVDLLDQMLTNEALKYWIALLCEILSLIFLAVLTWYGTRFALRITDTSPTWAIPRIYWFIVMPLSSGIMVVYSSIRIVRLLCGRISS